MKVAGNEVPSELWTRPSAKTESVHILSLYLFRKLKISGILPRLERAIKIIC